MPYDHEYVITRMLHGTPGQRPRIVYIAGAMAYRRDDVLFLGHLICACVNGINNVIRSDDLSQADKEATAEYKLYQALDTADPFVGGQSASDWVLSGKSLGVSGRG
jgi:hypothetical protein